MLLHACFVLITIITLANCLEVKQDDKIDDAIKNIITKYISKIPDVEPQYVIHEGLSKVISRYFKEKISTFPLYKISLKLDRNPVKIPWTMVDQNDIPHPAKLLKQEKDNVKTYKYFVNGILNKTKS